MTEAQNQAHIAIFVYLRIRCPKLWSIRSESKRGYQDKYRCCDLLHSFDLKLYLINNTVSSENISVEMSANENFLIAGTMVGKFCVQPMSTIAITYVLTGIEIGLLALQKLKSS